MHSIKYALLLVLISVAGVARADQPADPTAMLNKMLADAKDLTASSLPDMAQLGPEWKRAWELPGSVPAACPSQDEYWNRAMKSMGMAGVDPATAASIVDNMARQVAAQGGAEGLTARDGMVSLMAMVWNASAPTASKTLQSWESSAKTFQAAAASDETDQQRAAKSTRRILDMTGTPWKALSDDQFRQLVISTMTRVKRRTTMDYFRCSNWSALSRYKSADDAAKAGLWMGVVKLNLMLVDESRLSEVEDLKAQDAPTYQSRLSSAVHAMMTATFQMQRAQLDKKMAAATDDYQKSRIQADRDKLDKEAAAAQAMTVTVVPRQFGDNSYVIRIKVVSPDEVPIQGALYAGWIRRGQAMAEISLGGNFPEDQLNKEMDHFLSEMDAKLASYDSSLAGTIDLSGPAPQFAPPPAGPGNTPSAQPARMPPQVNPPPVAPPPARNSGPVAPQIPGQPTAPPADSTQADAIYNSSDFPRAKQAYDRILATHPRDAHALMMRGASKFFMNDLAGAMADYKASAQADPASPAPKKYWAFLELVQGDPKVALDLSNSALMQNSKDANALLTGAEAALALQKPQEAHAYLDRVRQLDPNRSSSLYNEASNALNRGMLKVALQQYRGVLLLDPRLYQAWYGQAEALARLGENKSAINAYQEYLKRDDKSQFAQHARDQINRLKQKR